MATQNNPPAAQESDFLITYTTDIVASYVANNSVDAKELGPLIQSVYSSLAGLGEPVEAPLPDPAVPIRSSVKKDHIVCLDCGKKLKMLKRHVMAEHGLTPDEYRARWELSPDYPLVAPDYAARRRDLAKELGLGHLPVQRRGRRKKAAPKG